MVITGHEANPEAAHQAQTSESSFRYSGRLDANMIC